MLTMPVLKQIQDQQERRRKIFPESRFIYDAQSDTYRCPAGQTLRKRKHWADRQAFEYVTAKGICQACSLRAQCTQSESGDELSNGMSAKSCWIIYVLMLEVPWRDETLGFVSISWRVRSRKRHGSD